MVKSVYTLILVLMLCSPLCAQVTNDRPDHAIALPVDGQLTHSNTTNCTLDLNCLNQVLTAKCLVYHNDQWFNFTTGDFTQYFLVVRNQACRDINGVQVIVFDGIACQPSTYKLIACRSFGTQDDVYLQLDSLKPHNTYLVNIDGYLNDHCAFDISISSLLPDFAAAQLPEDPQISIQQKEDSILLEWKLDELLQQMGIVNFEISRRFEKEKKLETIASIEAERSVKGSYVEDYRYSDVVTAKGRYTYRVVGKRTDGKKYLMLEKEISFEPPVKNIFTPQLHFKNHAEITVEVFNADPRPEFSGLEFNTSKKEVLLMSYTTTYFEKVPVSIDLAPYMKKGIQKIHVVITDVKRKKTEEFFYPEK